MNQLTEDLIKQEKERLNHIYWIASQEHPHLDATSVLETFSSLLPSLDAIITQYPTNNLPILEVFFETIIQLEAKKILGKNSYLPTFRDDFESLIGKFAPTIAIIPKASFRILTNTLFTATTNRFIHKEIFIEKALSLRYVFKNPNTLKLTLSILAWQSGLCSLREQVLTKATELPLYLIQELFGFSLSNFEEIQSVLQQGIQQPWYFSSFPYADNRIKIRHRFGGFVGFDGYFVSPPEIIYSGKMFYLRDCKQLWQIEADDFGVVLYPFEGTFPSSRADSNHFQLDLNGTVHKENQTSTFPKLSNWLSYASNESTLMVSLPNSHYIYILS